MGEAGHVLGLFWFSAACPLPSPPNSGLLVVGEGFSASRSRQSCFCNSPWGQPVLPLTPPLSPHFYFFFFFAGEYGLRNKREVWRVKFTLAKIRKAARELLTLDEKDQRRLFEGVCGEEGAPRAAMRVF